MADRFATVGNRVAGVAAAVVGAALTVVAGLEYVRPGLATAPAEPFATGILVVLAGVALIGAGSLATRRALDHLALRIGAGIGVLTLALAVLQPTALLFGGVFWLGLLLPALIALAAARTGKHGMAADR